jgi:hypothetical protein
LSRFIKDEDKLKRGIGDFIYKFVNEYSHGKDFTKDISAPMLEAKDIANNIMGFIRCSDKEHYDHLKSLHINN